MMMRVVVVVIAAVTTSIEFKRQVAQEFVAGETLYALAKRYDVSRNLIRVERK
jgi:hypothetical protein